MILAICALVALAGGVLLVWSIARMVSVTEASIVTQPMELLPSQPVTFDAPGGYVLYGQPMLFFNSVIRSTNTGVWDAEKQSYLNWNRPMRQRRDLAATRVPHIVVHVPRAGTYQLVLGDLDPSKAPYEERIVFGRYVDDKRLMYGFGILAGGFMCLGGIMIFVFNLS